MPRKEPEEAQRLFKLAQAGKVDGKNAYASSTSLSRVAGDLVATASRGPDKGKIPGRFLADVPISSTFGAAAEVTDNLVGAPAALGTVPGIGSLTASCADQSQAVGVEDPQTTITLTNSSGTTINLAKRIGGGNATVEPLPPNTVNQITITTSATYTTRRQNTKRVHHGVASGSTASTGSPTSTRSQSTSSR